jgi:hypothetical protein
MNLFTHELALKTHPTSAGFFDGKVRLKASDLVRTGLEHNFSFLDDLVQADAPEASPAAGCTEWIGTFQGKTITVGWDWYLDTDVEVTLLRAVPPRSNICVIDEKGYDLDDSESTDLLFDFLNSRFWHAPVKEVCGQTHQKPSH